jgi:hypothetical protein
MGEILQNLWQIKYTYFYFRPISQDLCPISQKIRPVSQLISLQPRANFIKKILGQCKTFTALYTKNTFGKSYDRSCFLDKDSHFLK